jgi:hypothetical protein
MEEEVRSGHTHGKLLRKVAQRRRRIRLLSAGRVIQVAGKAASGSPPYG